VLFGNSAFVAHCEAMQAAFSSEALCQLHQWQLWLEERGAAWPRLPLPLAERCHAAFVAEEGRPSRLQRQVVAALKALGHEPREEVRTPQGYSLDAVVRISSREVAIEVDGPSHFVGRTHAPTGATALKRRQLRAAGWALVPVPYWQWNALDATGQREHLLRELRMRRSRRIRMRRRTRASPRGSASSSTSGVSTRAPWRAASRPLTTARSLGWATSRTSSPGRLRVGEDQEDQRRPRRRPRCTRWIRRRLTRARRPRMWMTMTSRSDEKQACGEKQKLSAT
jgi:hypothetical protein